MNGRSLETLLCRLDHLERQVWWWKVVSSAAVGVLGFVVLIGATAQTVPGEIKANRVVIVDDAGKPRIVLGKGKDGKEKTHVDLRIFSKPERDHAFFALRGEIQETPSPVPEIKWENRPEEITLEVTSQRPTSLARDLKSNASFTLRTDRISTEFWLDGKDASLSFNNYAGPHPAIALDKRKGRLSLGIYEGRPTLRMGDDVFGVPGLVLGNASLSSQSGTTMKFPAASLVMLDKDGKIVWKAP